MKNILWLSTILLLGAPGDLIPSQPVQDGTLRGEVVDASGAPISGITVSLHQVSDLGGTEIGRAITDRDGRFQIVVEGGPGTGVYFAATRFDDVLYMGEAFRSIENLSANYRIVVGVGGFAGGPAAPLASQAETSRGWAIALLIALFGVGAIIMPIIRSRRSPLRLRATIAELAELEERRAGDTEPATRFGDQEYTLRREGLYHRIYQLTGQTRDATGLD